ncbi:hypothetical protein MVEN_02041700 [Mycena venus]|uniref:Uncharacterized protein n=1 Tax=Mycena venus TaxID=2733690 RepID=A0A8H6XBT3_9AGAR|nr:hypothetical protein MVEN_02041700 [Mycena venus]
MSSSANPVFPPGIVHPSLRQQPTMGISEAEMAWTVRRYGQFKDTQVSSHLFPSPGYGPQQNVWEGNYDYRQQFGTGYHLPLQPMQPSVAPVQRQDFVGGGNGFYHPQRQLHHPQAPPGPQHSENHGPMQNQGPLYSHVAAQYNGVPQHRGQTQHRSQPTQRGEPHFRGQSQRRQIYYQSSQRPRALSVSQQLPRLAFVPPDPEKTPTPRMPQAQHRRSEQPHSMFNPLLPPVDYHLVVKVGETVRIKPWADQYTWIEGRVEKADFSVIKNHRPQPRYVVSFIHPETKQLKQRKFCPHLSEIIVREPDEPGLQPLLEGTDRNIYACIPPVIVRSGAPIEKIWAHARILTPPDKNDRITIRVLAGPSKNFMFDDFPRKYTLPYCRASRVRMIKEGYSVAGSDEHGMEE